MASSDQHEVTVDVLLDIQDIRDLAEKRGLTGKTRKNWIRKMKKKLVTKKGAKLLLAQPMAGPPFTIVLVSDMTISMKTAADAIKKAFPWVYALCRLLNVPVRVAVYHDFDGGDHASPRATRGGWAITPPAADFPTIRQWCCDFLRPKGGRSIPEAGKTAIMHMLKGIPGKLLVINLTDAPVHGLSAINRKVNKTVNKEAVLEEAYFANKQWSWAWKDIVALVKERRSWVVTFCPPPRCTKAEMERSYNRLLRVGYSAAQARVETFDHPVVLLEKEALSGWQKAGQASRVEDWTPNNLARLLVEALLDLTGNGANTTPIEDIPLKPAIAKCDRQLVLDVCTLLITRENVQILLHPAFAPVWKRLCSMTCKEAVSLVAKMSTLPGLLGEDDGARLQEWILSSKKTSDEDIIKLFVPHCDNDVCVLTGTIENGHIRYPLFDGDFAQLDVNNSKALLLLLRTNPSRLGVLLSSMLARQPASGGARVDAVPLDLDPTAFFRYLPILLVPNLVVDHGMAQRVALACTRVPMLQEEALAFLARHNVWPIDKDHPANFATGLIRALNRLPEECLSPESLKSVQRCMLLIRARETIGSSVPVDIPGPSDETKALGPEDVLLWPCPRCEVPRPPSNFGGKGTEQCAICDFCDTPAGKKIKAKEYHGNNRFWKATCDLCKHNYYLTKGPTQNWKDGSTPKDRRCWYCQHGKKNTHHGCSCSKCGQMTVFPPASCKPGDIVDCKKCSSVTRRVAVKELLRNNPIVLPSFGFTPETLEFVLRHPKLPDLFGHETLFPNKTDNFKCPIRHGGYQVSNADEVLLELTKRFKEGVQTECDLCCGTNGEFMSLCGHEQCEATVCRNCATLSYTGPSKGNVVTVGKLTCPYCRLPPSYATLKTLRVDWYHAAKNGTQDRGCYTAWCVNCDVFQPSVAKACAAEPPNFDGAFSCQECRDNVMKDAPKSPAKLCAECGVAIDRWVGCNHVTCPCGAHNCWLCFELQEDENVHLTTSFPTAAECYHHLEQDHNGAIFGDE